MKLFSCDNCDQTLYFENSQCVNCGAAVGYCPEVARLAVLRPAADAPEGTFDIALANNETRSYRRCQNAQLDACNWLVSTSSSAEYCRSCELSDVIPDLSNPANDQAWRRIEAAKRRLVYTLLALKLPLAPKEQQPETGVAFHFLRGTDKQPVMTGHDDGVITLNIAEADSAFRENMREKMGEAYRTLLGHLRHEIGHYYWDRLIKDSPRLANFRAMFGDESQSYEDAIKRHYEQGAPADWQTDFVSAYASMHPWEDWAETWAHYLHIIDTLETAKSHGLTVRMPAADKKGERIATDALPVRDFEALTAGWNALTLAMNSLNRSMGMKDAYPFVLSPHVLGKLRYVHELVQESRATRVPEGAAA